MKKHLFLSKMLLLLTFTGLLSAFTSNLSAQINYTFNFDANSTGWTGNFTRSTASANNCSLSAGTMRRNLWASAQTGQMISPSVGTSNGQSATVSYTYKAAVWSANTAPAPIPWGTFDVQYGPTAAGPWTTFATVTNEAQLGNACISKSHNVTLPAGNTFIRWSATWQGGDYFLNFDNVSITQVAGAPCVGTPDPGTATITNSTGCASTDFTLNTSGLTGGLGVTYQWQSSPNGSAPWTDISGATSPSLTTNTPSNFFYRLRTFCSNSGQENFTNTVSYTIVDCFNVPFSGNNAITTCSCFIYDHAGPSANYANGANGFTVINPSTPGGLVQLSGTTSGESCCDFLRIYDGAGIGGTLLWQGVANAGTVPLQTSTSGPLTVQFTSDGSVVGAGFALQVACFILPDCAGTPNPGTATISATTGCLATNFTLNASGISTGAGIAYQWQSSPTGGAPWTDVAGGTTVSFVTNTVITTSYRLRTFCSLSGQENFSNIVSFTPQECYLVPFSGNNSITTCSGTLYDHNGATGDYAINANGFTVINPGTPGFLVQVSGTTAGEGCCDFLRIYDGVGIGGTLLWQGVAGAGAVPLQTSSTGALTVQFTSDFSINGAGFALNIACEAPCFGPAEPGFGANSWNITAYNGRDINLGGSTVLRGFYTESALSYNTQTAWGPLVSPSSVAGYTGCPVNVDNHTVVSKRQGVPTNGVYQIDVTNHDDEYILLVNGVKAFENTYANISHQGVSVGYFDGSTNFEMRHADGGGESKHELTFTLQNLNANVATLDPTSCAPSNGQITFSNPSGAVASPVFRSSFDDNSGLTMAGSANVSGGVLNLTPAVNSSYGTAVLTNQTNMNASVFRAEFDFRVFDGGGADGFSFNYAPSYPASPVYDVYEQGWGGGLSVSFITFSGAGGPFVRVSYNGVAVSGNVFASIRNANYRQCVVSVNASNQITVSIDGVNVITNLALPSAFQTTDKTNWQYAFASRTGGVNDAHRIDNVVINAFNQYEYSVDGATWSSNPQFTGIAGGTYTPQIRNRAFPAYPTTLPVVTLNNPTASGVSVVSAPAPYTWIDGNTYTSNNNTATFNIVGGAANGCDSLVTLNLTIIPNPNAPVNDVPCGAFNITTSGQTALNTFGFLTDMSCNNNSGNNTDANFDAIGSACNGVFGRSLWYTFTTPLCAVNGAVPFEIELSTNNPGTNFNTKVYLFAAQNNSGCSDLIQLACNDDHNGAGYPALCGPGGASASTIVATNLLPNTQYWVKVDGLNVSDAGNFVLSGRAVAPAHTTTVTGGGTQLQVTTQNMGAGLYTYYYKQVGSTGHSTFNTPSALTDVRTLSPGFSYQTQMMYRCGSNAQQSQFYRTAPQTIALSSSCAVVTDMTCTSNGNGTYTLTWTQPNGILFTNNGQLSGYILKRQVQNQAGIFTVSNPQPVCANGSCSLTVTGLTNPAGYNFWLETRCSANTTQQGNLSSCSPQAPNFGLNNDGDNNINRTVQNTFSFVNAQEGIEFIDVQMHDAYGNFGLDVPMLGDYEIFVNDNNEITWRRVDTPVDANFDFVIVPNPSNAMTTVHLNTVVEAGSFTIVDAMGRTINSGAISNTDNVNIDAAQLQSGVYMVVVTVGNQQLTRRLVVAN